jgi:hypothetical protein
MDLRLSIDRGVGSLDRRNMHGEARLVKGEGATCAQKYESRFGELLATSRGATRPSAVLLRSADRLTSDEQAALLAENLPLIADDLKSGAVVTIARGRMRIRPLPIFPAD